MSIMDSLIKYFFIVCAIVFGFRIIRAFMEAEDERKQSQNGTVNQARSLPLRKEMYLPIMRDIISEYSMNGYPSVADELLLVYQKVDFSLQHYSNFSTTYAKAQAMIVDVIVTALENNLFGNGTILSGPVGQCNNIAEKALQSLRESKEISESQHAFLIDTLIRASSPSWMKNLRR